MRSCIEKDGDCNVYQKITRMIRRDAGEIHDKVRSFLPFDKSLGERIHRAVPACAATN